MYSIIAGTFFLMSIGIVVAHAMDGLALLGDPSQGN
jgi:hypothetical protein